MFVYSMLPSSSALFHISKEREITLQASLEDTNALEIFFVRLLRLLSALESVLWAWGNFDRLSLLVLTDALNGIVWNA